MKSKSEAAETETSTPHWKKEDLELARKIFVLARIVHDQLVATHAWVAAPPRNLPGAALSYPAALPGALQGGWTVPAVWPCCP